MVRVGLVISIKKIFEGIYKAIKFINLQARSFSQYGYTRKVLYNEKLELWIESKYQNQEYEIFCVCHKVLSLKITAVD